MNIFVLDLDPVQAAKWHTDRHCVKMILESAQLLCSVFHMQGIDAPYKLTHKNHPCAVWARESYSNFIWLLKLFEALCDEYTVRYGRIHKSSQYISWFATNSTRLKFDRTGLTPFALAMPDEHKCQCPVHSYRNYYIKDKAHLHKWKANHPPWIN